jgi:hypothetical protein
VHVANWRLVQEFKEIRLLTKKKKDPKFTLIVTNQSFFGAFSSVLLFLLLLTLMPTLNRFFHPFIKLYLRLKIIK